MTPSPDPAIREVECFYCNGTGLWLEQTEIGGLVRMPCGECGRTGKLRLPVAFLEAAAKLTKEMLK